MPDGNDDDATPVIGFIVGTSRGGTTFMNKVLNLHPEVASFGESAFFGRLWAEPAGGGGRYAPEQAAEQLDFFARSRWGPDRGEAGTIAPWIGRRDPRWVQLLTRLAAERGLPGAGGTPRGLFDLLCRAMCEANGKRLAVEKTPHHLGATDRIERFYPEARYVLMVRDPLAFARSYKNQGRQFSAEAAERGRRAYHPVAVALLWRGYARQAIGLMRRCPDRVLRVTLDDLRRDEAGTLDRVQRHLGLDPVPLAGRVAPDNSSTGEAVGGIESLDLTAGERFWLARLAGREAAELGFDLPTTGGGAAGAIGHAVTLPAWGLRNLARYRRGVRGSVFKHAMRYLRPR